MKLQDKYKNLFSEYKVNTLLRMSHFLSQCEHESKLKPVSENLNYSAHRLIVIFPRYFKDNTTAEKYHRKPEKIANRVYANRMGNKDEKSEDGWKYRGRGFIQITGKNNYISLSKDTGIDYVENPDKLLTEADSLISALWFWNKHGLNELADNDDVRGITRVINGGYNGIDDRVKLLKKYKSEYNI